MQTHQLPLITIQHDLRQVIDDFKNQSVSVEDVWISCYRNTSPSQSVHGKLRLSYQPGQLPELSARDGVQAEWADDASDTNLALLISCPSLDIPPTLVSFPARTILAVQPHGIDCMDVVGDWIVTGGPNGSVRLHSSTTCDPTHYRVGRGHLSDLTSCQFFPSGQVLLTTSIDMSARIYALETSSKTTSPAQLLSPRTFGAPHGRSVTCAAIIGRGKEIVTGCKDSQLRLWNVAESKVVAEAEMSAEVLVLAAGQKRFLDHHGQPLSSESDGSRDGFVAVGLATGTLHFAHVPSLAPIRYLPAAQPDGPAITALALSASGELVAYATQTGVVTVCTLDWQRASNGDVLSLGPFARWARSQSPVNALAFDPDASHLLVAGDDGLPCRVHLTSLPALDRELAGLDCEPANSIRLHPSSQDIFVASKDGNILIYS